VEGGLTGALEAAGHDVRLIDVRLDMEVPAEIAVALETQRRVARCAAGEIAEGRFPLVLSGNCATCVGSVAAVGSTAGGRRVGVIWLDSHGDFNTPETSRSGFLDGMVLAMLTGDCWTTAAASVPGFAPVRDSDVVLVGARDFDPEERDRLDRSAIAMVGVEAIRTLGVAAALEGTLDELVDSVEAVYLHLDLDVLEPGVARVNALQAENGLVVEEVLAVIEAVGGRLPLAAAALTSYDPEVDRDGAAAAAARRAALTLAGLANVPLP
jgi:arginase